MAVTKILIHFLPFEFALYFSDSSVSHVWGVMFCGKYAFSPFNLVSNLLLIFEIKLPSLLLANLWPLADLCPSLFL